MVFVAVLKIAVFNLKYQSLACGKSFVTFFALHRCIVGKWIQAIETGKAEALLRQLTGAG